MATVAQNIVTNLRKSASVEASEFGDECFEQWTQESISEHNSSYLVDGSDLPSKEFSLIQLLVWAKLCDSRAAIAATQVGCDCDAESCSENRALYPITNAAMASTVPALSVLPSSNAYDSITRALPWHPPTARGRQSRCHMPAA